MASCKIEDFFKMKLQLTVTTEPLINAQNLIIHDKLFQKISEFTKYFNKQCQKSAIDSMHCIVDLKSENIISCEF